SLRDARTRADPAARTARACCGRMRAMPAGQYRVIGDDGETVAFEAFRSAPGPAGWRYFSTVAGQDGTSGNVDLSVDAAWRPVRARVQMGAHHTLLIARGDELAGVLDEDEVSIPYAPEMSVEFP